MHRWAGLCCLFLFLAVACSEGEPGAAGGEVASAPPTHPGEAVYQRYCFSCHAAGVAGAPKLGDAETWAPRLAKGREQLLHSTIKGMTPGMPERGLCFDCSDEELAAAIDYMLAQNR